MRRDWFFVDVFDKFVYVYFYLVGSLSVNISYVIMSLLVGVFICFFRGDERGL